MSAARPLNTLGFMMRACARRRSFMLMGADIMCQDYQGNEGREARRKIRRTLWEVRRQREQKETLLMGKSLKKGTRQRKGGRREQEESGGVVVEDCRRSCCRRRVEAESKPSRRKSFLQEQCNRQPLRPQECRRRGRRGRVIFLRRHRKSEAFVVFVESAFREEKAHLWVDPLEVGVQEIPVDAVAMGPDGVIFRRELVAAAPNIHVRHM